MKTRVDGLLREEAGRFSLRFACEDCAHVRPDQERRCIHEYPEGPRRDELAGAWVTFCKEFELA